MRTIMYLGTDGQSIKVNFIDVRSFIQFRFTFCFFLKSISCRLETPWRWLVVLNTVPKVKVFDFKGTFRDLGILHQITRVKMILIIFTLLHLELLR